MKRLLKDSKIIVGLSILLVMCQCDDTIEEFDERGILLVNIRKDWSEELVSNATVKVYKNVDDWAFEVNSIKTMTSDRDGRVTIKGLPEGEYYLDVISEDMSNWQEPYPHFVSDGNINVSDINIDVNFNYFISSASGKTWKITEIQDESGNDLSAEHGYNCMIGNNVRFEKAGYYSMDDGTNRCDTLPPFREGSWWGYDMNLYLLTDAGLNTHEYFIGSFFENYFILTDPQEDGFINYRYELIP